MSNKSIKFFYSVQNYFTGIFWIGLAIPQLGHRQWSRAGGKLQVLLEDFLGAISFGGFLSASYLGAFSLWLYFMLYDWRPGLRFENI